MGLCLEVGAALHGVLEQGNDNRFVAACFGIISVWFLGGLPWEVEAACSFASMLGNDNLWQCVMLVLNRVAWVG